MSHGGIARRIVDLSLVFFGRIRGGLGIVVTVSTFFFGAICGSGSAKTAAIGSVMYPELKRNKYPADFATALFAAAGGASSLVPPSIDYIIMGVIANISIGGLFAGGIIPAAITAIALVSLAFFYGHKLNLPLAPRISLKKKAKIILEGIPPLFMIIIVLGGIYGGVFTPTEAASVAVVYGFLLSFFIYRELLSFVLTFQRVPHLIAEFIAQHASNWMIFVLFVNIVFLILGMLMDALPAIIVLMPIIVPLGVSLGMDPIHIGVLVEANVGLGMITPPVGVCLFVACGISNIAIEKTIPRLLPFLLVLLTMVILISLIPQISLFLPRLLGY